MWRDDVMERLEQLRTWRTRFSERRVSCTNSRRVLTKSEMNDNLNVCAGLSQKNWTELRDVCKALSIPWSGHEPKPQLTRKIKEEQAERAPLQQATLDFGRHRGKTYEWVGAHDKQNCEWAVMAVVEDGATASPVARKVHLRIYVDEATKSTVAHVWVEGQQAGNVDGSRNAGYQFLRGRTHCEQILKERGVTGKCTKG